MTAAQDTKPFVITRTLNAPRKLVWQAFTEADRLKEWFGPKGFTPDVSKMDLRPGGTYHYRLKGPDGSTMWGKWVFREIVPQQRLVMISSFSDENAGVTRHPMAPTWPRELLSIFTFEDAGDGKTQDHHQLGAARRQRGRDENLRRRPAEHDTGVERHLRTA